MDKLSKPEWLDVYPNATKIFNHWYRTITSFLRKTTDVTVHDEQDKMYILINSISSDIYDHIAEYTSYESAVNRFKELYVKHTHEISAKYILATCGKKNEDID